MKSFQEKKLYELQLNLLFQEERKNIRILSGIGLILDVYKRQAHKYPLMRPMLLLKSDVSVEGKEINVKMHIKGAEFLKAKKTDREDVYKRQPTKRRS